MFSSRLFLRNYCKKKLDYLIIDNHSVFDEKSIEISFDYRKIILMKQKTILKRFSLSKRNSIIKTENNTEKSLKFEKSRKFFSKVRALVNALWITRYIEKTIYKFVKCLTNSRLKIEIKWVWIEKNHRQHHHQLTFFLKTLWIVFNIEHF